MYIFDIHLLVTVTWTIFGKRSELKLIVTRACILFFSHARSQTKSYRTSGIQRVQRLRKSGSLLFPRVSRLTGEHNKYGLF